jgi:hypothetical protein
VVIVLMFADGPFGVLYFFVLVTKIDINFLSCNDSKGFERPLL